MTEYQIQPNTRRCAVTGRELVAGEKYFSVLLSEGAQFIRQDFSGDAWRGPPEGAFSFWSGRVPSQEENKRPTFDDEMLLDCFQRLETQQDPQKVNFRYVLSLLLLRRKKLKFEQAAMQGEQETLTLRCVRSGTTYQVVNPRLQEEQLVQVQDEVVALLGWG